MRTWEQLEREQEAQHDYALLLDTLSEFHECKPTEEAIQRALFKQTRCGAWITFPSTYPLAVTVGTIVEGVDGDPVFPITVPYDLDDESLFLRAYEEAIAEIEEAADDVWMETHGCPSCYGESDGGGPVNPDCPECQGAGMII